MSIHLYLLAIVMGAVMSIYIPMISQSARILGAAVMGNVPFFFVAFVTSVVIAILSGQRGDAFAKIAQVPPWLFLAGVMSAGIIVGATFLVPRIGTGALFVLLVTGQILAGVLINQFGLLGVPAQPMTLPIAAGAAMVVAGAALVTFGVAG
ncbi:MAG: DMT family transporter [Boseongicola sp.]|nr:DMT family transporter [Boseongicola sp.]